MCSFGYPTIDETVTKTEHFNSYLEFFNDKDQDIGFRLTDTFRLEQIWRIIFNRYILDECDQGDVIFVNDLLVRTNIREMCNKGYDRHFRRTKSIIWYARFAFCQIFVPVWICTRKMSDGAMEIVIFSEEKLKVEIFGYEMSIFVSINSYSFFFLASIDFSHSVSNKITTDRWTVNTMLNSTMCQIVSIFVFLAAPF